MRSPPCGEAQRRVGLAPQAESRDARCPRFAEGPTQGGRAAAGEHERDRCRRLDPPSRKAERSEPPLAPVPRKKRSEASGGYQTMPASGPSRTKRASAMCPCWVRRPRALGPLWPGAILGDVAGRAPDSQRRRRRDGCPRRFRAIGRKSPALGRIPTESREGLYRCSPLGRDDGVIRAYSDSDWAGCPRARKSTSEEVLCIGRCMIKHWSSTPKAIALSCAEA